MNRDKYGILGQIQPDGSIEGGDALNWECHYRYFTSEEMPPLILTWFNISSGAYVRHPSPNHTTYGFGAHYRNPWNGCISRDQLTGIIGYLIKFKERRRLLQLILHHMAWGFLFAYNTIRNGDKDHRWKWPDFTGPDIWAMELRGIARVVPGSIILLYPILCLLDIHLLLNTLYVNRKEDNDVLSFVMKLCVSLDYYPTPLSSLAGRLLKQYIMYRHLYHYWGLWRRQPEMASIHAQYLEKILR